MIAVSSKALYLLLDRNSFPAKKLLHPWKNVLVKEQRNNYVGI